MVRTLRFSKGAHHFRNCWMFIGDLRLTIDGCSLPIHSFTDCLIDLFIFNLVIRINSGGNSSRNQNEGTSSRYR